jgi:cytochrome c1
MLVQEKVRQEKVPAAQEAYLFDRIAMYEGCPQRFGTQSLPCADGQYRRWKTEDPEHLNERRAEIAMSPLADDPPETEPTPEALAEYLDWLRGYEDWLRKVGWRQT